MRIEDRFPNQRKPWSEPLTTRLHPGQAGACSKLAQSTSLSESLELLDAGLLGGELCLFRGLLTQLFRGVEKIDGKETACEVPRRSPRPPAEGSARKSACSSVLFDAARMATCSALKALCASFLHSHNIAAMNPLLAWNRSGESACRFMSPRPRAKMSCIHFANAKKVGWPPGTVAASSLLAVISLSAKSSRLSSLRMPLLQNRSTNRAMAPPPSGFSNVL
mmetsp:Transcript_42527/g.117362  ORF Transcript_42527/g.117362 Transcript_42527/m.117362 type:complete len:221 (-) Transcript_42527:1097-1759(-)